jgi:WD40 repeat protein
LTVRVHDSEFSGHRRGVNAMAFSLDSARLATGGDDQCVVVWNLANRRLAGVLRGHRRPVRGVAFSPDGSCLASCGDDGTVKVWQLPRVPAA